MKKVVLIMWLACSLSHADSHQGLADSNGLPAFETTTVTFANGAEGWFGSLGSTGNTKVVLTGGNPEENLRTDFLGFGVNFKNSRNPEFVFDYTERPEILFSIDVKVDSILMANVEAARFWVLEIRDLDNPPEDLPYTSVWYEFEEISLAHTGQWTRFTAHIPDTSLTELPPGWSGSGAVDEFYNPILPPDRTFTDVLANMDEISFQTLKPGFSSGQAHFKIRVDNISIGSEKIFDHSFESMAVMDDEGDYF